MAENADADSQLSKGQVWPFLLCNSRIGRERQRLWLEGGFPADGTVTAAPVSLLAGSRCKHLEILLKIISSSILLHHQFIIMKRCYGTLINSGHTFVLGQTHECKVSFCLMPMVPYSPSKRNLPVSTFLLVNFSVTHTFASKPNFYISLNFKNEPTPFPTMEVMAVAEPIKLLSGFYVCVWNCLWGSSVQDRTTIYKTQVKKKAN